MSEEPYWDRVPLIFKREVVRCLNLKDRNSLGKVSKSDRELVRSVPIFLMDVGVSCFDGISITCHEHPQIVNGIVRVKKYTSKGEAIDKVKILLSVFENPKSLVGLMYLDLNQDTPVTKEFLLKFCEEIQKRPSDFKIRAKQLNWYHEENKQYILDTLERIETKTLKGFKLDCPMSPEYFQKVLNAEQVLNLNSFGTSSNHGFPVTKFLIWNQIDICLREISSEDVWEVIKNYRSKPRPAGSHFKFFNFEPGFKLINIDSVMEQFDEQPNNLADDQNLKTCHIQVFKMETTGNNVLKVELTNQMVSGTVTAKINI